MTPGKMSNSYKGCLRLVTVRTGASVMHTSLNGQNIVFGCPSF